MPCLLIVEKAVYSIRHSTSALKLDSTQTVQLITVLDRAFMAIVAFLIEKNTYLVGIISTAFNLKFQTSHIILQS